MSKATLIDGIATHAAITKKQATAAYNSVVATLQAELAANRKTELPGIGNIKATPRPAKDGRNPRTGEKITIPAGFRIGFSASKALKDALV
jgi:DNA-binding protein HU-beta